MSKADGPRVRQLITDYAADARVVALRNRPFPPEETT